MHTERNSAACPSYINYHLKRSIHYALLSAMFTPLHSSTNQELFKKHLYNQNSHYEKTDDFRYERKPSRATTKSTLFAVSKEEWDTKEDTGKSMKNALCVLRYAKRHLSDRSNVKQGKNQARSLSHYRVTLV